MYPPFLGTRDGFGREPGERESSDFWEAEPLQSPRGSPRARAPVCTGREDCGRLSWGPREKGRSELLLRRPPSREAAFVTLWS